MDTSGRAILLAGTTVVIALLGMFATGVSFMYGLAIASVLAVLLTLRGFAHAAAGAPLALRPPAGAPARRTPGPVRSPRMRQPPPPLARARRPPCPAARAGVVGARPCRRGPGPLALVSLAVMVALLLPVTALRMTNSDAGNSPANLSSRHAFDLLAQGFGAGFNGPLTLVAELHGGDQTAALAGGARGGRATP